MRVELEPDQLILKSHGYVVAGTLSALVKAQAESNEGLLAILIDPTRAVTSLLLGEKEGSVGQACFEVAADVWLHGDVCSGTANQFTQRQYTMECRSQFFQNRHKRVPVS